MSCGGCDTCSSGLPARDLVCDECGCDVYYVPEQDCYRHADEDCSRYCGRYGYPVIVKSRWSDS